mmetsp:Transcript_230/g.844  ORF Transcript_230/g.844 Transcript_230/m.844 type:complete len:240 (+) Transcript_230:838-1557(+)
MSFKSTCGRPQRASSSSRAVKRSITDGGTTSWNPARRAVSCMRWCGGKTACRRRASKNSSRFPLWTARSSPRSQSSKVLGTLVRGSICDTLKVNARLRMSSSVMVLSLFSDSHNDSSINWRSSKTNGSPTRSFSNFTFGDASRHPPWASKSIFPRPRPMNRYSSRRSSFDVVVGVQAAAEFPSSWFFSPPRGDRPKAVAPLPGRLVPEEAAALVVSLEDSRTSSLAWSSSRMRGASATS